MMSGSNSERHNLDGSTFTSTDEVMSSERQQQSISSNSNQFLSVPAGLHCKTGYPHQQQLNSLEDFHVTSTSQPSDTQDNGSLLSLNETSLGRALLQLDPTARYQQQLQPPVDIESGTISNDMKLWSVFFVLIQIGVIIYNLVSVIVSSLAVTSPTCFPFFKYWLAYGIVQSIVFTITSTILLYKLPKMNNDIRTTYDKIISYRPWFYWTRLGSLSYVCFIVTAMIMMAQGPTVNKCSLSLMEDRVYRTAYHLSIIPCSIAVILSSVLCLVPFIIYEVCAETEVDLMELSNRRQREELRSMERRLRVIDNLESVVYISPLNTDTGDKEMSEGNCCSICHCEFVDGERVRVLACKHMFHQRCIDAWLATKLDCPYCRVPVRAKPSATAKTAHPSSSSNL